MFESMVYLRYDLWFVKKCIKMNINNLRKYLQCFFCSLSPTALDDGHTLFPATESKGCSIDFAGQLKSISF
jgi:hypothetical protein